MHEHADRKLELEGVRGILSAAFCASGEMADAPDLGSGPVRGGGSSPLSRTINSLRFKEIRRAPDRFLTLLRQ